VRIRELVALLLLAGVALGAQRSLPTQLRVVIRPEASLTALDGQSVAVKIRLTKGTDARLAAQEACTAPPENAIAIAHSGTYPSLTLNGTGKYACLYTAERTLSVPVPQPAN
jgi:hypothetical protein